MTHEFVEWPGFIKQANYCKKCGDWEHEASPWYCRAEESTVERDIQEASESTNYPYVFMGVDGGVTSDQLKYDVWSRGVTFNPWQEDVEIEFEDGTKTNIHSLNVSSGDIGRNFRFIECPTDWQYRYGIDAERYAISTTASTPGGGSTGIRPRNSYAGIANGSQYGQPPGSGLGSVSDSLEDGDSISGLRAVREELERRVAQGILDHAKTPIYYDNGSED